VGLQHQFTGAYDCHNGYELPLIWQESLKTVVGAFTTVDSMGLSVGRRSEKRVYITATLPIEFLERTHALIDNDAVPSRSFVIVKISGRSLEFDVMGTADYD